MRKHLTAAIGAGRFACRVYTDMRAAFAAARQVVRRPFGLAATFDVGAAGSIATSIRRRPFPEWGAPRAAPAHGGADAARIDAALHDAALHDTALHDTALHKERTGQ